MNHVDRSDQGLIQLSPTPRTFLYENFASPEENAHLIAQVCLLLALRAGHVLTCVVAACCVLHRTAGEAVGGAARSAGRPAVQLRLRLGLPDQRR